jgi:hypothetical protein
MKISIYNFLSVLLYTILFAGCNERKETNTEAKENPPPGDLKTDKQALVATGFLCVGVTAKVSTFENS